MKILRPFVIAVMMILFSGEIVSELAVAKPVFSEEVQSVQQQIANETQSSTEPAQAEVKKSTKKKYRKADTQRVALSNVAVVPEEPVDSCFLIFCANVNGYSLKHLEIAAKYDGYTAQKNRQELRVFLSTPFNTDVDPMRIAWCAAFVNAVLQKSGYDTTDSLMARSFLNYGKKTKQPQEGDIVVLTRGKDRSTGHVGFFLGYDETRQYVKVLGGNQGKMVTVAYYPIGRVISYRKLS